ncbi:MAG: type III-B CRISPR module RAMP protein Cmr1 [Bacteroidia bacterium]|nr:type III-B CRISPR module RAMP protein Cmr1 [Bacteroidia bacterium]
MNQYKMKKVIFSFETVTPMFLGGADMNTPEIRVPAIKGALRFWWRAMNAHLVQKKNDKWDYSVLKQYETAIFGGTDPALQSRVKLRLDNPSLSTPRENFEKLDKKSKNRVSIYVSKIGKQITISTMKYLGYGLYDFKDNTKNRNYLEGSWDLICEYPENPVTVKIKENKAELEKEINIEKELQIAFSMLNLFGTLGSKARNGFGSVQITSKDFPLLKVEEVKEYLKKNQPLQSEDQVTGIVPYTAFKEIEIIASGEVNDPKLALDEIAVCYSKTRNNVKDKNYISEAKISKIDAERYPKRYYFSVKKTENGKYQWQCLYLPVLIDVVKDEYKTQNKQFQEEMKNNYKK